MVMVNSTYGGYLERAGACNFVDDVAPIAVA